MRPIRNMLTLFGTLTLCWIRGNWKEHGFEQQSNNFIVNDKSYHNRLMSLDLPCIIEALEVI